MLLHSNQSKLNPEVQNFILDHISQPIPEIALRLSKRADLPKEYILNQINGLQKAKTKFPFLLNYPEFVFPSARSLAQASSEKSAQFKANLINANTIVDLSGGLGIDCIFFAKNAQQVVHIEENETLSKLAAQNFKALGIRNISNVISTAEHYIEKIEEPIDLIYVDPDRRKNHEKAFRIRDCEPNLHNLLPKLRLLAKQIMIKLSPMLDIKQALLELECCKMVYVVAVNNECKELLFLIDQEFQSQTQIQAVNILENKKEVFQFRYSMEQSANSEYSEPLQYLYEPNAALLKAGAFNSISHQYKLKKIAPSSHLYTSNKTISDFPGRTLLVEKVGKPQKGFVEQANVVSRNFKLSPDQIKKKFKIKDGGALFLHATSLENNKPLFILSRPL